MKPHRLALTLGTAGAGVLAAAFLQPAVAAADSYNITPDPESGETFTALDGQPPLDQAVDGIQLYDYQDLTTGYSDSFTGVSLNAVDPFGVTNQEILDLPNVLMAKAQPELLLAGDNPLPQGSFFDTLNYGHGFENVYTDLAGTGTGTGGSNTITDTVVTPFGNFNIPTTFDATAALQAAEFTYPSTSGALPGYSYVPDTDFQQDINSIGGTLPFDQWVSGTQTYDVDDATGAPAGEFDGVSFNDVNALGQSNQEILVTPYLMARRNPLDAAFAGGGLRDPADPSGGSLFDTTNYGSGFENVYSDVAATDTTPQTITDTFVTPFGDVNIPTTFDASAAVPAAEFTYPSGPTAFADFSYVPDSDYLERVNSISGQALVNQTVSGTQLYDVNNPAGVYVGEFDGVSTHSVNALGFSNQEILVTDGDDGPEPAPADGGGDTAALGYGGGDAPASGSFFDTFSGLGFENVYSDVVGTDGANTVTDTLVTPFGDFTIPTSFDATAVLNAAEFLFPTGSTAADLSSLFDLGNLFSL